MKDFSSKVKPEDLEPMSAGELADTMPNLASAGVSIKDIRKALSSIDMPGLKKSVLSRLHVKIWEEGDLIGGIALREHPNPEQRAKLVRNLDADGKIYLIYVDGKLTYNQWHIKGEGLAPITEERLQEVVDEHLLEIAQTLLQSTIRAAVLKTL